MDTEYEDCEYCGGDGSCPDCEAGIDDGCIGCGGTGECPECGGTGYE